jgi:hypothetical protein
MTDKCVLQDNIQANGLDPLHEAGMTTNLLLPVFDLLSFLF